MGREIGNFMVTTLCKLHCVLGRQKESSWHTVRIGIEHRKAIPGWQNFLQICIIRTLFDLKRTSSTFPAQLRSRKYYDYLHMIMIFVNSATGNPKICGLYIYANLHFALLMKFNLKKKKIFPTKSQIWWFHYITLVRAPPELMLCFYAILISSNINGR